ncbi:hypothetical protein [Collimonas silvisoli]|uniref:hypothetical protein n=1 Tax=Collimonas silvisoli TaxID=2825884 RepID=UPI001B8C152A|nr:hypothetical protein [Collimonas silvisoli]
MSSSKLLIALLFLSVSKIAIGDEAVLHGDSNKRREESHGKNMPIFEKNPVKFDNRRADESKIMNAFISYGQSWRSQSQPVAGSDLIPDEKKSLAFAPKAKNTTTLLPAISSPWVAEQYGDLEELNWGNTVTGSSGNASGNIGNIAARTLVKLSKGNGYSPFNVVDFGMAYPGYTWQQLQPGTQQWTVMLNAISKIRAINSSNGKLTRWLGVGWTHGSFSPTDKFDYFQQLQQMVSAFDKLALNSGNGGEDKPLHYYIDMFGGVSDMTVQSPNTLRQLDFSYSDLSRFHLVNPRYPYPFAAGDNVHHSGIGYAQYGEAEGLAKFYTLVAGIHWEPFRIVSGQINGSKISLKVSAPMVGFGKPEIDTSQIERASQLGFHVKAEGIDVPVKSVSFTNATTIALQLPSSVSKSSKVEVSYAWYGPGAPFGTHAGVWGNIKRKGPPSVLFRGKTIDLWLCNYIGVIERAPKLNLK